MAVFNATTIICVRRNDGVAMAGDGQVSNGNTVLKHSARKVKKIYGGKVLAGFAGGGADALTLFEKFEAKLEKYSGNLERAAIELAKDWRTDRVLRRLEALMIVADAGRSLLLSGSGDIVEPDDGILAIGSGGNYALAAARALLRHSDFGAADIARRAMEIAAEICVFTNDRIQLEELA